MKQVLLIGGPNGAGKTTAAFTLLPRFVDIHEFVNADEMARGLNPLNPSGQAMAAGKLMINRMRQLMQSGKNFAFETTCAGSNHAAMLEECKAQGYAVVVVFFWLPGTDMAIERVAQRVARGGHDIPEATIRRRYAKGLQNLTTHYLPLADRFMIYDNSVGMMRLIAEKKNQQVTIHDADLWENING